MFRKTFMVLFMVTVFVVTAAVGRAGAEDVMELDFMHVFTGERGEAIGEIVETFNERHDNIEVSHQSVPGWYGGLLEQLQSYAVTGNLPDVTLMGLANSNYMRSGLQAVSLQKYLDEDGDDLEHFDDKMLELARDDGEQYALPFAISTPLLYVNYDLMEEAGIEYTEQPESWMQVKEWAKKLNDLDETTGGIAFQMDFDTWQFQMLLETFGGEMASIEDKEVKFNEEPGRRVFEFWEELRFEDESWPLMDGNQAAESFLAGDLGMIVSTTGNVTSFVGDSEFDIRATFLPLEDGQGNERKIPAGGSNIFVLPSNSEKERAAYEFARFAVSPEAQAIIVEEMGYMSANQKVLEENGVLADYLDENPLVLKSYEQSEDLTDWFNWPEDHGNRITSRMLDEINLFLEGSQDVDEVLESMTGDVEAILDW